MFLSLLIIKHVREASGLDKVMESEKSSSPFYVWDYLIGRQTTESCLNIGLIIVSISDLPIDFGIDGNMRDTKQGRWSLQNSMRCMATHKDCRRYANIYSYLQVR